MQALAFDYGLKKTGVACGQTTTGTAQALETVQGANEILYGRIGELIDEWRPDILVVGKPVSSDPDKKPGSFDKAIDHFARELEQRFDLPVEFVDETLTSHAAHSALRDGVAKGKKLSVKKRDSRDAKAAELILGTWLSSRTKD